MPSRTRAAEASRARIFEAAKSLFSSASYDSVGVREIAKEAGVDAALVMRYFGSKEALFASVAEQAFEVDDLLEGGVASLHENAARIVMGELDEAAWLEGYDPLRFLLASVGSPTARPLLATHLAKGFVAPLAKAMGGEDAMERATLLAAQIIGLALMRVVATPKLSAPRRASLRRWFARSAEQLVSPAVKPRRTRR